MKQRKKAVIYWLLSHWRGLVTGLIAIAVISITLGLEIFGLVPGQNQYEVSTLKQIEHSPIQYGRTVNMPYLVPAYFLGKLIANPMLGARITSLVLIMLASISFYYILDLWYAKRTATVGTLLFATNAWILSVAHQAAPYAIMVLAPLLIIVPLAWYLRTTKHRVFAFYCFSAGLALAAYVPLMGWLMLVSLIILLSKARRRLHELSKSNITIGAIIYSLLLLPLLYSLLIHPGQLYELLAIPKDLPSPIEYLRNFADILSMIFVYSKSLPELHLGTLPILDIFSASMFIVGIYFFALRWPKRRSLLIFGNLAILAILLPLTKQYQLYSVIMLPIIYICITTGIVELLNRWFVYFPRNPWAKNLGISLCVLAIGFSCYYNLMQFYIAWPNSPETKSVYMVKSDE